MDGFTIILLVIFSLVSCVISSLVGCGAYASLRETPKETTPQVTTPPVTTPFAHVTTPPVTTPPVTTPSVTTPSVTTQPVTTPPVTTPPVTKPPVTKRPVTKAPSNGTLTKLRSGDYMMIPNPRLDKKAACKMDIQSSPTETNNINVAAELCSAVAACKGFYGRGVISYVSTDIEPLECDEDITDAKDGLGYANWYYKA
jgi:hypothetical protein